MLDPRLADVLPAASNLIRFARRFRLADLGEPDDAGIVRHVFGGHWHRALGWCALAGL